MLLSRLPLPLRGARLACVRPAASVRSEPGSNSQVELTLTPDLNLALADEALRSGLHSILTSSQSYPRRRWNRDAGIHGVFKRPQVRQCRDVSPACARERPPGHRRLRFSFQFNDVKDPEPPKRPRRLAPGCGGGGYLLLAHLGVNRSSGAFFACPVNPDRTQKPAREKPRGIPLCTPGRVD